MLMEAPRTIAREKATAIALNNVTRRFVTPDGKMMTALRDFTMNVAQGEFACVVGPTGCGKSTLLNAVAGLLVPASGTVEISGQRLQGLNRKAGYLFQQDALMPWKTVLDNVSIGLEIAGTSKAQAREQAREWLGRVGLASFGDRYPHMLSGGQRKRVGLAQVLIRNPKYLLMDEPFGPLDAQTRVIMGDLLLDL